MKPELTRPEKQTSAANNRRLGFALLSIAIVFFIGILLRHSLLN
jgi:hypothetical protein